MFEKNAKDFRLSKDLNYKNDGSFEREFQGEYRVGIGTWHNSHQSLIDALMYLETTSEKDKSAVIEKLERLDDREDLFIGADKELIKESIRDGFNPYSIFPVRDLNDLFRQDTEGDRYEGFLDEGEYYVLDKERFYCWLDEEYMDKAVDLIDEAESITELYEKVLELKQDIRDGFEVRRLDFRVKE